MKLAALVLAGLVAASPGLAQLPPRDPLTAEDFLKQAVEDNAADIEIGRMVRNDPAQPQGVHQVGEAMARTSAQMNKALEDLAGRLNVRTSGTPSQQDGAVIQRLSRMDGSQFTEEYLQFVIDDLERDITLYQRAIELENEDLRQFAHEALPVLRMNRAMAQKVMDQQLAEQKERAQ